MAPENLLYARTHEWVRLESDAAGGRVATVGVTAFALEALTDLVYIELPKVGQAVTAGAPFGEIESVKAVSDLYSPVEGEVVAVHDELAGRLETLSADPYGDGWMVKIRLSSDKGVSELLDHAAYDRQCAEEQH